MRLPVSLSESIEINGQHFKTVREACSTYGVTVGFYRSKRRSNWSAFEIFILKQRDKGIPRSEKMVTVLGVEYPSINDALKAHGISKNQYNYRKKLAKVYGWTLDEIFKYKREVKKHSKPNSKSTHKIMVLGVEYSSIKEALAAHGLTKAQYIYRKKLAKAYGWTLDDLFSYQKTVYEIEGVIFKSLSEVCRTFNVTRYKIQKRVDAGECVSDAVANELKTHSKLRS